LDYNQLKLRILHFFKDPIEYDSAQILRLLLAGGVSHRDKAVEMALMRYWRQGLLSRTRRSGRFYYRLTERGLARREWLSKALKPSEV
jgi:DNA-binding transcriptional regulator PaaX